MTGRFACVAMMLALLAACGENGETVAGGSSEATSPPGVISLGPLPTDQPPPVTPETPVTAIVSSATSSSPPTSPPATTTAPPPTVTPVPVTVTPPTTIHVAPARTACKQVAFIGDSVSLGMTAAAGFDSQLSAIGVAGLHVEVSGGRSIVETLTGQENAATVASRLRADGFAGCWVVAVGTNDAANIAAGAARQADERITAMMAVIGRDPVLWVDAASIATDGFWAAPNIDAWNQVLSASAATYPNMRIARWSAIVRTEWFEPDGVHITAAGSTARIAFVARQLIVNFPASAG